MLCLYYNFLVGQSTFDLKYNLPGKTVVYCLGLNENPDSTLTYVTYAVDSISSRQDFGLSKVNKNGLIFNQKSLNYFGYDYNYYGLCGNKYFALTTDCSYFLAGGILVNNSVGFAINKVNRSTLDTIKSVLHLPSWYSNIYMCSWVKLSNTKYMLIGNNTDQINQWPTMVVVDSNLTLLQKRNIINPTGFGTCNAIRNPITKQILVIGSTPQAFGWDQPITFMHIDSLGNVQNVTLADDTTFHLTPYPNQIIYSPTDTSYVTVGIKLTYTYSANSYFTKIAISKYNALTLQPKWNYIYGTDSSFGGLADAYIDIDGSIICSGSYAPKSTVPGINHDSRGILVKVNKQGVLKWVRDYNRLVGSNSIQYSEAFYSLCKTRDGGTAAVGTKSNPDGLSWLVKTDSLGCTSNSVCPSFNFSTTAYGVKCQTLSVANGTTGTDDTAVNEIDLKADKIIIYPTIAVGEINYYCSMSCKGYKIFSSTGQFVSEKRINGENKYYGSVFIGDFSPGVYTIVFETDSGDISRKFIKQNAE